MKRKLMITVLVLCLSLSIALPASAAETTSAQNSIKQIQMTHVNVPFTNESVDQVGQASTKDAVVINGITNYLYPTFDELDSALVKLKSKIPDYYRLVEKQVDLTEAYDRLYTEYQPGDFQVDVEQAVEEMVLAAQNTVGSSLQSTSQIKKLKEDTLEKLLAEKAEFDRFLDIYENKAQNEEIKAYLESNPNPDPEVLAYMLPYTAPFSVSYFENAAPSAAAAQTFNITDGTAYAVKWATKKNPAYPDYAVQGGDCANFASQILVAGGIKMHMSGSVNSGWWLKKIGTANPGYSCSNSWCRADSFVKFMGTSGNMTTNFKSFSAKLKAGDFISYDQAGDKDWDHVGYVTATGNYGTYDYIDSAGVTRSKSYTTFCVAQHSKDYYAWVHSRTNGWELLESGNNLYAIVRRGYSVNF